MFVTLAGTQRHEKRVDIYKSASVACERFTRTRQTVCDPDRQAGRQGHEKGLTFIRVEDIDQQKKEEFLFLTFRIFPLFKLRYLR